MKTIKAVVAFTPKAITKIKKAQKKLKSSGAKSSNKSAAANHIIEKSA